MKKYMVIKSSDIDVFILSRHFKIFSCFIMEVALLDTCRC